MMKYHYLLIMLFLALASCQSAGDKPERVAKDICSCLAPLARSYEGINDAVSRKDMDALHRYAEEMDQLMSECGDKIESQYGPLEGELGERVKSAMQQACPDIVATLNEVESEFIK